jgi:hypothetical protein
MLHACFPLSNKGKPMENASEASNEMLFFELYRLVNKIMNDAELSPAKKNELIDDSYTLYSSLRKGSPPLSSNDYAKLMEEIKENELVYPANAEHFLKEIIKITATTR